jgi:alpha-L-fucosidase
MMKHRLLLIVVLALLGNLQIQSAAPISATELAKSDLDARMQWFAHDRFGMFIHWGVYAVLGGEWQGKHIGGYAEWIQASADISKKQYSPLTQKFNPTQYDPEKWVLAAKAAGMKYIVITTKHHDGFCLWPSKFTAYDIDNASPFKRDILAELSAACKKHGIKFGTYYSLIDWHHPSQFPNADAKGGWAKWGKISMKPGRKKEYVTYMKNQIKELIDNYGTELMWFDGDWAPWWTLEDGDDLYRYIRKLKPSIIINNRVSKRGQFKYDYGTPENFTPGSALKHYWEACWTMNKTWGYSKYDDQWKSDQVLIQKLVDIASKGGNLLLNVGPKADGVIQQEAYTGLHALGRWMKVNSESIYGTQTSAVAAPLHTRLTAKGENKLYLHLLAPMSAKSIKLALTTTKATAKTLDGGSPVPVRVDADSISLNLANVPMDKHVTTIAIDLPDGYKAGAKNVITLQDGDILLNAADAKVLGKGPLKLQSESHALGNWTRLEQSAQWKREVVVSGKFELILIYSLDKQRRHGMVTVTTSSGTKLDYKLQPTSTPEDFRKEPIGKVSLTAMKPETITVTGSKFPKNADSLMNLRGIILRPVK